MMSNRVNGGVYAVEKRSKHILRSFRETDTSYAVRVLVDSFRGKFQALTNLSDEKLYQLLQETELYSGWHHDGCLVIEMDGKVVGIMTLKWLGQKRTKGKASTSIIALIRKYGLQNVVKAYCGFAILSHNPKPGECYIEHIAVSRESRGLGLGTVLLQAGEKVVHQHPDLDTYSLYVSKSNTGAIQLYESLGFETMSSQSSSLTKLLLKEPTWLYMTKRLKAVK